MIRSWWAAPLGLLAAALTGGTLTGIGAGLLVLVGRLPGLSGRRALSYAFDTAVQTGATFTGLFLIGLVFVGGPVWVALHRSGRRSRKDAIVTGVVLAGGCAILISLMGGIIGLIIGLGLAVALAVPAGAAGWVLHAVAYQREPTS